MSVRLTKKPKLLMLAAALAAAGVGGWMLWENGLSRAKLEARTSDALVEDPSAIPMPQRPTEAARSPLSPEPTAALDRMTAANWREVLAALEGGAPGSTQETEWTLALAQAGALAGKEAVEELLATDVSGGGFQGSAEAFSGWAAQVPDAAWDWLSAAENDRLRSALLPRFAWGLAQADTQSAITHFSQLAPEDKAALASETALSLIQSAGYEAADDWLDHEMLNADGDPGSSATLGALFDAVTFQREQAVQSGGSIEEMCDWLLTYADQGFVRSEHFLKAAEALGEREGRGAAVDWLSSVASAGGSPPVREALRTELAQWTAEDAEAARRWAAEQAQPAAPSEAVGEVDEAKKADGVRIMPQE
ncbi:MAG: hypothetical protein ACR2OZ_08155 [Verrucomicrobiales bacterium]